MSVQETHCDSSDEEQENRRIDATPITIDWLDLSDIGFPSSVAISQLPGCKFKNNWRSLTDDLETLKKNGIKSIYTLCTRYELNRYKVPNLLEEYKERGFHVHHFPFLDGTIPEIEDLMKILTLLQKELEQKFKCLIHCYGGLGRACLVAACLLLQVFASMTPEEVIENLRRLRGKGAVQTVKQYNFIMDFRKIRDDSCQDSGER